MEGRMIARMISIALATVILGCSGAEATVGQASDNEPTADTLTKVQRDTILLQIELHGMDSRAAVFRGEDVVVEDDIVFHLGDILAEAERVEEKGYEYNPLWPFGGAAN